MSAVLNTQTQLTTTNCYKCGVTFGMQSTFYQDRVRDHREFYCPNGHGQHFISETDEERLRKQLAAANSRTDFYRREAQMEKRSKSAVKGQLTKVKNRIAKGVCPCCNRTFEDLARHMNTKHPDYASDNVPAN